MSPYRKPGELTWYLTLPTGDKARPYLRPTSMTRDEATAKAMQAMLDLFGARGRRWLWIRDAIIARRVSVPQVYDAYLTDTLDVLQAQLTDRDLRPELAGWEQGLVRALRDGTLAAETVRKYRAQVAVLTGEGPWWKSTVTAPALKALLDGLPGSGTNRRRHAAAWTSLLDHCVEAGALEANPLRTLKLPKSNRTRERHAEWAHVERLLHALPAGVHRALAALRHGGGFEMQAALRTTRRDIVDVQQHVVWAHGAKTDSRDRQAVVLDDGCWEIFWEYVRAGGFLPDAPLFPVSARAHARAQAAAAETLRAEGVPIREDYTLHAARHSFAVEMVRRGYELKLISQILGHGSERTAQLIYAKYRPRTEDLVRSAERTRGRKTS